MTIEKMEPDLKKEHLAMDALVTWFKDLVSFTSWLTRREIAFHQFRPREALFFLTYRCSCHCRTCEMWKRKDDYPEMGLDEWKNAVDQVAAQGVEIIYLFGGDIFLRQDILIPLAHYIHQKGVLCDAVFNGNLITKETAEEIVHSGAYNLGISIDAIGDLHNKMRGVKGLYERAVQGLKDMLEARGLSKTPSINIYCTISNLNIDKFHEVLPLALELGVDQLHFELYGEFDKYDCQKSVVDGVASNPYFSKQKRSLLLNREQAIYLQNKLRQMDESLPECSLVMETEHITCLSVDDMVKGDFQHQRCYLARYHINVDPSGNIIPCLFFQNYHLGNINETEISKIWGNEKHRTFVKSVDNRQLPICKNCMVGIQRNPTFMQALTRRLSDDLRKLKSRTLKL